jgi:bifunctional DNA-binding transcriptional regulator/antitoxin component of YhaV-PrlF toxin-antitoxin module
MTIDEKVKVGKKGEILPKKPLREISGIHPGDNVLIEAQPGRLIINKIFTVEELLEMPIISQGTAESVEKEIEEEVKIQEKLTNEEH